ncbi:indole-3-glycerol phosphate synthase TrpC [Hydrogenibacillus sp. N12]|uniref:indole-3-glycerol phosphate synthase TrpC n=1 Tax=Hydrogenibacillus sp. N12 TaxID=2866627 RepID=UPI001C7DF808|nr:indole-3-glycerol phosphate synthase TrpC [Hydrogenibacillus sp. N12]QZA33781.1 indole-3-glycerol phosphate synthase TrpC [Hydrogenibacillus sp. N12]
MLETILSYKRLEVDELRRSIGPAIVRAVETGPLSPVRSLAAALRNRRRGVALIAEAKKASPSKGVIREGFDPVDVALAYRAAAVDAVSVLTDRPSFLGDRLYLPLFSRIVERPVLRKDFILDPLQLYESRLLGADAVLLIVRALRPEEVERLLGEAHALGLEALVEVHDERELDVALSAGARIIGINNRDLATFRTDRAVTERLVRSIPNGVLVVSESGIRGPEDVDALGALGVDAVLVGEHLMRQPDLVRAVRALVRETGDDSEGRSAADCSSRRGAAR